MLSLATRRLIDATATLDPADRALLNLWVNRGLDDERLTALTGMSVQALRVRREKIVTQLAGELGVPPRLIRGALEQLSPDGQLAAPPDREPITGPPPSANGTAAPARRRRRHDRRLWLGLVMLAILVAVVIAVNAAGQSSPQRSGRAAGTSSAATAAPTAAPLGAAAARPLGALPGGPVGASGSIKLAGLSLDLTVRGLAAPRAGHYEVWLYNSVLDSHPLGPLRAGQPRLVARLPADARRYRWIDISLQPPGVVNHSGESELRASNPAHTP